MNQSNDLHLIDVVGSILVRVMISGLSMPAGAFELPGALGEGRYCDDCSASPLDPRRSVSVTGNAHSSHNEDGTARSDHQFTHEPSSGQTSCTLESSTT